MILLIAALASYRLTRLIVEDTIAERPRNWLMDQSRFLESVLACYWCAGMYVSGLVAIIIWVWPTQSQPFLMVFALSASVGILSALTDRLTFPSNSKSE